MILLMWEAGVVLAFVSARKREVLVNDECVAIYLPLDNELMNALPPPHLFSHPDQQ
jgi:hypothetical protein